MKSFIKFSFIQTRLYVYFKYANADNKCLHFLFEDVFCCAL